MNIGFYPNLETELPLSLIAHSFFLHQNFFSLQCNGLNDVKDATITVFLKLI